MSENVGLAFGMVAAAGMCTAVGASLVLCGNVVSIANKTFLASALGVSAGVMLYVTFVEIFQKSLSGFQEAGVSGDMTSGLVYVSATLCFFGGVIMMMLLDKLVHWLGGNVGHDDFGTFTSKTELKLGAGRKAKEQELPESLAHLTGGCHGHAHGSHGHKMPPANHFHGHGHGHGHGDESGSSDENKSCCEEDSKCGKKNQPAGATPAVATSSTADVPMTDIENPVGTSIEEDSSATITKQNETSLNDDKLTRMGLMTALAIGLHNFPEGIATFVATLEDPRVGAALAVAIGIHNIPEGLCVSIPIYYATGSRTRALGWALLSGLSEPIGALLAYLILMDHFGPMAYGLVFGFVGGMMAYICLHELIPTAHRYDPEDKVTTISIIVGMMIMATSLVLFVLDPNPEEVACNHTTNITL